MTKQTLSHESLNLIQSKYGDDNKITFGVLLLYFERVGRFPNEENDNLEQATNDIFIILKIAPKAFQSIYKIVLNPLLRNIRRFKNEIRLHLKFRSLGESEKHLFLDHCKAVIFPKSFKWEQNLEQAYTYLRKNKIEPCSFLDLDKLLATAHREFESTFFSEIEKSLSDKTKEALDKLLEDVDIDNSSNQESTELNIKLGQLKEDKPKLKIDSVLYEVQKYKFLSTIDIPKIQFGSRHLLIKYYERILVEAPSLIKKHNSSIRYAYLAIFCVIKKQLMTDTLTDMLLKLLHRIRSRSERAVDKALKNDNKRVKGKLGTLLVLAKKSIDNPAGVIRETIYPDVPHEHLSQIVTELGEDGQWYFNKIKTKALSLYSHNNRRLVWALIDALTLKTGDKLSTVLGAIHLIKKINIESDASLKNRLYNPIILKNLVTEHWHPFIIIKNDHPTKVNMNWQALELALFEKIEKQLPTKNIWVEDAYRYRNPAEDMPADFDENEDYYFDLLGLPKDADVLIKGLKDRLNDNMSALNKSILTNTKVVIKNRGKSGSIKITPFDPQAEPQNIDLLKLEVAKIWPNLHLLDILKETEHRIGFTKLFQSVSSREVIKKETLTKRLLLCIFGIGSNTGIKRMSGISIDTEKYDDLRYVKKRFMTCQNIRFAIQDVVNEVNNIRDKSVWGEATTSCASDSKKMSVWDQNLMVEWHARYGGRGVMIYWHVDKKGLCIHSKLKTCSSSEVGAMIHGVLYHDTAMDMDQISVDTHGQSAIGFAFSELFDFDLLPRIKNINKQKLYCSSKAAKDSYTNLTDALAPTNIVWKKIKTQYREIVKLAAALKLKTVDPDVLMKRLSADNKSDPVDQALMEMGKASRTIFLCRYLSHEDLRIEINEALNVVERVNGIMEFIFYGRLGEISSNSTNEQEMSLLCLHLLQVCMVHINTLLIQEVLSDPKWKNILNKQDMRALSPLLHGHINPYGFLHLDMAKRLNIKFNKQQEGKTA